jgi:hypothetical protein
MGQSTMSEREMADAGDEVLEPIDIYGPEGIRDMLRSIIQLTYSRVVAPHRIHELKNVPNMMKSRSGQVVGQQYQSVVRTRFDPAYGSKQLYNMFSMQIGLY